MNKKSTLTPMLFTSLKGYTKEQAVKDVISGVIVAIIALPLSIALALASGVTPEQGLYTAIIAGFLISFFGGSRVQIAGPTAAFATIVAGIVYRNGMAGLVVATVIAGILLILMGVFRLGTLIKFIPYTITTGFTAGIAVTIVIGQLKDFFGIRYMNGETPIETVDKIKAIVSNFGTVNLQAVIVGAVCLAVLIIWPKISEKIPGSLIAVIIGIVMVSVLKLKANTIGDLYTISSALPKLTIPKVTYAVVRESLGDGFTIAVLAAIESLLSCVVSDSMINSKHNSNMELVAQGIGNIGSALFGGIPATGAIARTAANIKNGGKTPVAGMVHAVILLLVLVLLMPYAALIPMPTIAAILFMVAWNMCGLSTFVHLLKTAPKSDVVVLVITFVLTVVFDLVVAIGVGLVMAMVLFLKRISDETQVLGWKYYDENEDDPESVELMKIPQYVRVYAFNGPMFFGVSDLTGTIRLKDFTRCLDIRMRGVPSLDATAINALENLYKRCEKNNVKLVLSHLNEQPYAALKKAGFIDMVGEDNCCPHIEDAIARATELGRE
ncbi:MAG: SulP family inorganic anion transporter [Clostridia bacterium]|nr:SulP family inorganic anion transporter [Clostridia bacterium]